MPEDADNQRENNEGFPRGDEPKPPKGENLRPFRWKPGQSGNPKGRPKQRSMRERIVEILNLPAAEFQFAQDILLRLGISMETIEQADMGDLLALTTFLAAVRGKSPHMLEIMQRVDGKVPTVVKDDRMSAGDMMELVRRTFGDDPRVESLEREVAEANKTVRVQIDYGEGG